MYQELRKLSESKYEFSPREELQKVTDETIVQTGKKRLFIFLLELLLSSVAAFVAYLV